MCNTAALRSFSSPVWERHFYLFFVKKQWFDFGVGKQHLLWKIFSGGNDASKVFIMFPLSEDRVQYHVQAKLSMLFHVKMPKH